MLGEEAPRSCRGARNVRPSSHAARRSTPCSVGKRLSACRSRRGTQAGRLVVWQAVRPFHVSHPHLIENLSIGGLPPSSPTASQAAILSQESATWTHAGTCKVWLMPISMCRRLIVAVALLVAACSTSKPADRPGPAAATDGKAPCVRLFEKQQECTDILVPLDCRCAHPSRCAAGNRRLGEDRRPRR